MIHLDLFSGIGGFSKGLQQAGFDIKKHYFSEIDKHAIAIFQHQFKEAEYVGSVTDEHVRGIERPNIITFGSPCQDFSIAGKRAGMEGARSSLVTHSIELIAKFRPDFFIWENVKGTFSSNDGADFWAIIKAFTDIGGYRLEWQLLNTSWFLPQNRERIYLVGTLGGKGSREIFPLRESDSRTDEGTGKATTVGCLTAGGNSGGMHSNMTLLQHSHGNLRETNPDVANSILARDYKDATSNILCLGSNQANANVMENKSPSLTSTNQGPPIIMPIARALTEARTDEAKQIRKETKDRDFSPRRGKELVERKDELANTITATQTKEQLLNVPYSMGSAKPNRSTIGCRAPEVGNEERSIRRLTEIECERLQGFPDNWTEYGNYDGEIKKVSATQRYKCLGNAVTVDVVEAVGRSILGE